MAPGRKRPKRASARAAAKKLRMASIDDEVAGQADEQQHNEVQFVHKPYKSDATLLSLDDDCFFSIFNRLSLIDLCSMCQTCQRLQQVGSEHFKHRHKSRVLIIDKVIDNENLIIGPKGEEYLDAFTASLRNVTLGKHMASIAALKRLAKFYKFNEMAPIKRLCFESWSRGLTDNHGSVIANMVADVESFKISNSKVIDDLHECILQYLPKMNRLTIWKKDSVKEEMSLQWLENAYLNLRYFAWHTNHELPIDLAELFLATNPGIRFCSLQSKSQNVPHQLVQRKIRVNELFFTVSHDPSVFAVLQNLCLQQGTRLHLMFPDRTARLMLSRNMPQFIQLAPYIDGLYFEGAGIDNNLARTLTTFDNLKILQHDFSSDAQILATIPTLQEVYCHWGVNKHNFRAYRETMMVYATRSPNLKRIYMRNNSKPFDKFKIDEMNVARKRLPGACKLKIHFRTDELSYMGALNDIQRVYDTIEIERVESEEVNNPLVNEYLIGEKTKEYKGDREFLKKLRRYGGRWW